VTTTETTYVAWMKQWRVSIFVDGVYQSERWFTDGVPARQGDGRAADAYADAW